MLFLSFGLTTSAHAQSIVNGDFITDISGWTTQGPNTMWVSDPGPDSVPGVMWINDIPGVAFAEQTITGLTVSQTYTISGFYKSHSLFFGPGSFTASIDGTPLFANTDSAFVSTWEPFSLGFTASATSALLRLDTQVGNDSDYTVDKITIASAAAPEPGSLALLASIGVTGAGILARRKQ
jgi:hypothetical protein